MGKPLKKHACGTLLLGLLALGTAHAEDPGSLPYGSFEIAPFFGYQIGGNFQDLETGQNYNLQDHSAFAIALDAPAEYSSQYELFYSRQPTKLQGYGLAPIDVTVEYLQIGGTIPLDDNPRARPYLAGGLGISRFSPSSPGNQDTVFSMSLAFGLRAPITRHLSARLEARGLVSFMDSSTAVFCRSGADGAVCHLASQNSAQFQLALLAGLAYQF